MAARITFLRSVRRLHTGLGTRSSVSWLQRVKTQVPCSFVSSHVLSTQPSLEQDENNREISDHMKDVAPLKHPDYFGVRDLFTIQDLFEARVHMGHKKGTRNEGMKPYLFGNRLGVDILDLDQTKELLGDALNVMAHIAYRQGIILFVSRHLQTLLEVEQTAKHCGEFSHCREWKGGSFTNSTIQFGLTVRLPDLIIFVSTHNSIFEQHIGVVEAAKMNIPSVGIVDSSCDPSLITYPVPGNDDTPSAIQLYCRLFKEAVLRGKAKRREDDQKMEDHAQT